MSSQTAPETSLDTSVPSHPVRTLRWLLGWVGRILGARPIPDDRSRVVAESLRVLTLLLALTGLVIGFGTDPSVRKSTFTPLPVHILTVLSILTFLSVGFWMLCRLDESTHRPDEGTRRIGWLFLVAACIGASIYAASSYSYLALRQMHWPGGVVAGWFGDVAFAVTIAVLFPPFLTLIPTGRRRSTVWRPLTLWLAGLSAALLLVGMLFERHLYTLTKRLAPLASTSFAMHWARPVWVVGLTLLAVSVCCGFLAVWARAIHPETSEEEWNQLKWYIYGVALATAALIPYLLALSAPDLIPSAPAWARAWGAVAVAALAVAAVPATEKEPWHTGKMRRLGWGALVASSVTAAHEFGVMSVARTFEKASAKEPHLGAQLFATYGIALGVAVAFEPAAGWVRGRLEERHHRHGIPDVLLEQALKDLHSSAACLDAATKRATVESAQSLLRRLTRLLRTRRDGEPRRRVTRVRALEREIGMTIVAIRQESSQAATLIAALEEHFGRLASASQQVVVLEDEAEQPSR